MPRLKQVLAELHRRSLWQVLGLYVVASWFVLQVVDTLTSVLRLPDWFPSFALVLLLVGLPIVLATAFVQVGFKGRRGLPPVGSPGSSAPEAVPSEDAPKPHGRPSVRALFTWRKALGGGVLAFALWGVIAAGWLALGGSGGDATSEVPPGVAVLPLEYRSSMESDAFFTDGLHDELLTQLSKVRGLKVISRTSVMGYRDREVTSPEIGEELGVDFIVEGGLLRAGDQVRLNVQLIRAATDEHVWAESYDRALTVENLLAIQTEIVRNIVREVRAVVSPEEIDFVAELPTRSTEAYELYLRGEDWLNRGGLSEEEYTYAARFYAEATAIDPDFAVAYAKEASAHARLYFQGHDVTPSRLAKAKAAMDRALALDPSHPEVREGYGDYLYYGLREYEAALTEYRAALDRLPNSASLLARIAWVQRRQGRWQESLDGLERVREMDPRSASVLLNHGTTLMVMRRYDEAAEAYELGTTLNPDNDALWWLGTMNELYRVDVNAAEAWLARAPTANLRAPFATWTRLELQRLRRDPDALLSEIARTDGSEVSTSLGWAPLSMYRGWALQFQGDAQAARAAFDEARESAERAAAERPADDRVFGILGMALAELGLRDEAVAAGERGVEILGGGDDALWGTRTTWNLARIHARLGDVGQALGLLEEVTSVPGTAGHPAQLALEPLLDPIRSDPRFQALVERERDRVF